MFSTSADCVDMTVCSEGFNTMLRCALKACAYVEYSKEMYKMKLA